MKHSPRILCIDDNVGILDDFRKILTPANKATETLADLEASLFGESTEVVEQLDFRIDTATQGEEGYQKFVQAREERDPYVLVFVDMRMPPGWDGLKTMLAIWDTAPEQFIVLCTAYSDYSHEELRRAVGNRANFLILKKPFQPEEIQQLATSAAVQGELIEVATDSLTGLLTRTEFVRQLHAAETSEAHVLSLLSIDDFSLLAHSLVTEDADEFLKKVGKSLLAATSGTDILCGRVAIDQFAFFYNPWTVPTDLSLLLESRLFSCFVGSQSVLITFSEGRSVGEEGVPPDNLMVQAETALREARLAGRGQSSTYDPRLVEKALHDQQLEREFSNALMNGELEVHFQPIFSAPDRAFVGAEALLRWMRNGKPVASPDFFIPIAERSGLIVQIGDWVTRTAITAVPLLQEAVGRDDIYVSINASNVQLDDPDFADRMGVTVMLSGCDPRRIGFEVTESRVATNVEKTRTTLSELQGHGFKILIDDFGSGFSSLNVLATMPFDVVKLDRGFVLPISDNESAKQMVCGVLGLIRSLQKTAIAEGVETQEQWDILTEFGCDMIQGFLLGKALPLEELIDRIRVTDSDQKQVA